MINRKQLPALWAAAVCLAASGLPGPAQAQAAGQNAPVAAPDPAVVSPAAGAVTMPQVGLPATPEPQAGVRLLAPMNAGVVRPAGSGVAYKAGGSLAGPGGYAVERPTDETLRLSLDDAIGIALKRNISLRYQQASVRAVEGYRGEIFNSIIPNLELRAASSAQQLNLAALGFNPSKVGPVLEQFGIDASAFATIVEVNTTSAQINLNQTLFNLPDFELLRAVKPELQSVHLTLADADEQLVQAVAGAYLRVLADQANLQNTMAQEASAQVSLDQATARDQAGVGVRLDVLRARVELQQRQQAHIAAETRLDKDGIQLNRIMGIPAGQPIDLTDRTPYSELGELDLQEAEHTALSRRNDLLSLQQAIMVASHEEKAVRYQRYPTLAVNGFYGVIGETTGLYHGYFSAAGSVQVPVFREAGQRGEQEQAAAQLQQLHDQEGNLRGLIDAQVRTSILDVDTSSQLVRVARSNVELAQQELADARARFAAGVNDNLEVVNAETAVTGAEAQMISALYQFNVAKVTLARSTGVLESRYRSFLGM